MPVHGRIELYKLLFLWLKAVERVVFQGMPGLADNYGMVLLNTGVMFLFIWNYQIFFIFFPSQITISSLPSK